MKQCTYSVRNVLKTEQSMTHLGKQVAKSPSDQGCHCLGNQRLLVKGIVVGSPSGNRASADLGLITEERTSDSTFFEEADAGRRRLGESGLG